MYNIMHIKYSAKTFKDNFPVWKKKNDSFLVRHFFRPISFYIAAFLSNCGFTANQVSIISLPVGIVSACLYIIPIKGFHIAGAIIAWLWMLLDCTDGNIARTIKKEKYGEFIDALSSYVFIPLLFMGIGVAAYFDGDTWIKWHEPWVILFGSLAGLFDVIPRLAFQKMRYTELTEGYRKTEEIQEQGKGFRRVLRELGLNGLFLPLLLICTLTNTLGIMIIFYFFIQLLLFSGTTYKMVLQVIRAMKQI